MSLVKITFGGGEGAYAHAQLTPEDHRPLRTSLCWKGLTAVNVENNYAEWEVRLPQIVSELDRSSSGGGGGVRRGRDSKTPDH